MDLLALDIGNSRIGWALFGPDADVPIARGRAAEAEACAAALAACRRELGGERLAGVVIAASCVKPAGLEARLSPLTTGLGRRVHLLGRDLPIALPTRLREPDKAGTDRLAAALGAMTARGKPVIVVDAGTAVTVDLVDAQGCFAGGAILPGLRTQLWSLHARTAGLPEVALDAPPADSIGRDTAEAVRAGVYFGLVGAVRELVGRARRTVGVEAPAVATGGDGRLLAQALDCLDAVDDDLVVKGVREWVRRGVARGWRPEPP
jgi:type III pantothenate kinase